jgi:hypothetical protein
MSLKLESCSEYVKPEPSSKIFGGPVPVFRQASSASSEQLFAFKVLGMMTQQEIEKLSDSQLKKIYRLISEERNYRRKINKRIVTLEDVELVSQSKKGFKALPSKRVPYVENLKYLKSLLKQDWSFLFKDDCLDEEKKYYVYAHVIPKKVRPKLLARINIFGEPFYIGKGTGGRAYDMKRNQGHGKRIKRILDNGYTAKNIVNIIKDNLSEAEAYELESKLIYFFGTIYEPRKNKGILLNLDIGKRPFKFSPPRKNIIIKNGANNG